MIDCKFYNIRNFMANYYGVTIWGYRIGFLCHVAKNSCKGNKNGTENQIHFNCVWNDIGEMDKNDYFCYCKKDEIVKVFIQL